MKFVRHLFLGICLALSVSAMGQTVSPVKPEKQSETPEIRAVPRLFEPTVAPRESSAANVPPSLGRPILFVHGCGGNAADWSVAIDAIKATLMSNRPDLYSSGLVYGAIFDGSNVYFYDFYSGQFIDRSQIPSSVRFFTILFYDQRQATLSAALDPHNVWNIAIPVKANEVSQIIAYIQDIVLMKDLILVGHSMGGLVARAYVEGLAGPIASTGSNSCDWGICYTFSPGATAYSDNVGSIITLDTPHGGAPFLATERIGQVFAPDKLPCAGVNRNEMVPTQTGNIIGVLNYVPGQTVGGVSAQGIPANVNVRSIKSYNNLDWSGDPDTDGILTADTQDVRKAIISPFNNLFSVESSFGDTRWPSAGCYADTIIFGTQYFLHPLLCVGVQTQTIAKIVDGVSSDMLGVPLGVYSISLTGSLVGGNGGNGTVTLTTAAPVHGALVQLTSDDASLQVPASIGVSSGMSTANFNISTSPVQNSKTVHITAAYGRGNPQQATITVLPAQAQVQFSGSSLNFSTQLVNLRSIGQQVLLTNTGTLPLTISGITISGDFEQGNNCPATLGVNASCQINVIFHPRSLGGEAGTLTVTDSAPGSPHTVGLSGSGFDIVLNVPRGPRPHRGNGNAGSARREFTVELATVGGGTPAQQVRLVCKSAGCSVAQGASAGEWNVVVQDARAARLGRRLSEVILEAIVGGAVREIRVPVNLSRP